MSNRLENEIDRLRVQLSRARKQFVFIAVVCLGLTASVFQMSTKTMVTIVPPEINKTFWVSNTGASAEYLEEMALYVASLSQNYTPKNIDYKHSQILKIVHPSVYGALKSKLDDASEYSKSNNVSQIFHPDSSRIDVDAGIVHLNGIRERWVNDEALPSKQIVLVVSFGYEDGLITLKSVKEKE